MATEFAFLNPGPVTASLVVGEDGSSKSELGNSKGLGNQTDLELLLWFRSRSQIVLTSGATAEADNYKYPANTELAILSRAKRNFPRLTPDLNKVRFLQGQTISDAIKALQHQGFTEIHTEFGETGFLELSSGVVDCYLSSKSADGIEAFLERTGLVASERFSLPDLEIARVVGRGRN